MQLHDCWCSLKLVALLAESNDLLILHDLLSFRQVAVCVKRPFCAAFSYSADLDLMWANSSYVTESCKKVLFATLHQKAPLQTLSKPHRAC